MVGVIRCNKCGTEISKQTGACPKCSNVHCHIVVPWHSEKVRYYNDSNNVTYSYRSALRDLVAINREIDEKTFRPELWKPGAKKERLLENAIDRWLREIKQEVDQNRLSFGTLHSYRSHVNNHILNPDYGLGKWDVREIGSAELKRFSKSLPQHLIIKTQRTIVHTLRAFFSWLAGEEMITHIPKFPMIKGNNSKERFALSIEDQAVALAAIPLEHRDVFEFEMETGIRPGETCALRIKDFDFTTKTVRVQRTFTMGKLRESDKEGHKKSVPLTAAAFKIVQHRAHGRFPEDWLFVHPRLKRHYTTQFLELVWKKHTQLPLSHYEGTRHSYATQITEVADIWAAKELLRHSSMRSTEHYVHRRTEYLRVAQAKRTMVVDLNKAKEQKG